MDALPFVDLIEADQIDLLLISQLVLLHQLRYFGVNPFFYSSNSFHLDHCGALPWFLQKTTFKGRCFMTHATKAIYRWLLSDYIKVKKNSSSASYLVISSLMHPRSATFPQIKCSIQRPI